MPPIAPAPPSAQNNTASPQKIAGEKLGCSCSQQDTNGKCLSDFKYPHCIKGVIVDEKENVVDFILTKNYLNDGNYNTPSTSDFNLYSVDDKKNPVKLNTIKGDSILFNMLQGKRAGEAYISNQVTFIVGLDLKTDINKAREIHRDLKKIMTKGAKNKQDRVDKCINQFISDVQSYRAEQNRHADRVGSFNLLGYNEYQTVRERPVFKDREPKISDYEEECRTILEDAEKKGLLKGGRRASKTKRARHSKKKRTRRN